MAAIPVPYIGTGSQSQTVLGHYMVAQKSGAIAATLAAASAIADIRWAPTLSSTYAVLMRIRAGIAIVSAITTAVQFDLQAIINRGFTADFAVANGAAQANLATGSGRMRAIMSPSQMGTKGPIIAGTAALATNTSTADANAIAEMVFPSLMSVTATGTAVALQAGTAWPMQTLYEWTGLGQHPVVLANNEGVVLSNISTGPGTGTYNYYVEWTWAEVLVF